MLPCKDEVPALIGRGISPPIPNLYHVPRFVGLIDREGVSDVPHHENRRCDERTDGETAEHKPPKELLLGG